MVTSWRIATLSHYYFYEEMSLRRAYPIVRINFVTVFNTFIAVYRHANRLDELRHTVTRLTSHVTSTAMTCRQLVSVVMKRTCVPINIRKMTVVSSTVHEIFNKHRLWVSQTQRECRCYKQSASSAGLMGSAGHGKTDTAEFLTCFSSC